MGRFGAPFFFSVGPAQYKAKPRRCSDDRLSETCSVQSRARRRSIMWMKRRGPAIHSNAAPLRCSIVRMGGCRLVSCSAAALEYLEVEGLWNGTSPRRSEAIGAASPQICKNCQNLPNLFATRSSKINFYIFSLQKGRRAAATNSFREGACGFAATRR